MSEYLLFESRDPFETAEVTRDYELAAGLARAGNRVTLFLVQNGVLPARSGARGDGLAGAIGAGVEVLSDAFSLRERGITQLAEGVRPAELETAVDMLAAGRKAVWL